MPKPKLVLGPCLVGNEATAVKEGGMMTMPKTQALITSDHPKGQQYIALCRAAYNKAGVDEDRAQRLNERGGEFQDGLRKLIVDLSAPRQFANEEVRSSYTYPAGFSLKPIGQQVDILVRLFSLSLDETSRFIEKLLPTLILPEEAEGYQAIPSIDAVAARFFPEVKDPAERYCRAVQLMLEKLGVQRRFVNYRAGQLGPNRLRQQARTVYHLGLIAEKQTCDILVVPVQCGLRHRNRSVRQASEMFSPSEFGLGAFAVGCQLLTHPEREQQSEQLHPDCAGDEYSLEAGGPFDRALSFDFACGALRFDAAWSSGASDRFGSASAFLPLYQE